jgi:hypothetical protein
MAFFFTCCAAQPAVAQIDDLDLFAPDMNASSSQKETTQCEEICEVIVKQDDVALKLDANSDTQSTASPENGCSLGGSDFEETRTSADCSFANSRQTSEVPEQHEIPMRHANAMRPRQADWWSEAEISKVKGMHDAVHITKLLEARVVRHAADQRSLDAWLLEKSKNTCEELDLDATVKDLVSVCLNVGTSSLLLSCEVLDKPRLTACLANDPLSKRLKLVLNPVQVKLPFPAKGPKDAETIGSFFGKSACLQSSKGCRGEDLVYLRVDLFSKWILKLALQKVGFRVGNVVEILIVDWAGPKENPGVLAACRLSVTEEYMKLLA